MLKKRKGISTFIATLLLMVLAVSAGVVIYAYTMGYMGGFGGTDTLGAMSLDEGEMIDDVADEITAYVRNIGKTTISLDTAYVDGIECTVVAADIIEGEVEEVTITPITGNPWEAGKTYAVKLIAEDNTQLSFSLKCK